MALTFHILRERADGDGNATQSKKGQCLTSALGLQPNRPSQLDGAPRNPHKSDFSRRATRHFLVLTCLFAAVLTISAREGGPLYFRLSCRLIFKAASPFPLLQWSLAVYPGMAGRPHLLAHSRFQRPPPPPGPLPASRLLDRPPERRRRKSFRMARGSQRQIPSLSRSLAHSGITSSEERRRGPMKLHSKDILM